MSLHCVVGVLIFALRLSVGLSQTAPGELQTVVDKGDMEGASCVDINVTYICNVSNIHVWSISGTNLQRSAIISTDNIRIIEQFTLRVESMTPFVSSLTFTSSIKLNGSTISCINGTGGVQEGVARVLGELRNVGNLTVVFNSESSFYTISWDAVTSLDPSTIDPNITYCVNITDSSSTEIVSQCGSNTTEYIFNQNECDGCSVTVTPVHGFCDRNGPQSNATFPTAPPNVTSADIEAETEPDGSFQYRITTVRLTQCRVTIFTMTSNFTIDCTITSNVIIFSSRGRLSLNQVFRAVIFLKNAGRQSTSSITLRTTGVQNTLVNSCDVSNCVNLTATYSRNTTAQGVLFILIPISGNVVDFNNSVSIILNRTASINSNKFSNIAAGDYMISAYDVESDKLLNQGINFPATTSNVSVSGDDTVNQSVYRSSASISDCSVVTDDLWILVNCSFYESRAVGMVVIVQSSAIDSVNELIVGVSADTCNPVVLQLNRTGTHQVTVFPHMEGTGIIGQRVEYTEERNISGEVTGEVDRILDLRRVICAPVATTSETTPTSEVSSSTTIIMPSITTSRTTSPATIIAPVVIVVILLLALIIVVVIVWQYRKRKACKCEVDYDEQPPESPEAKELFTSADEATVSKEPMYSVAVPPPPASMENSNAPNSEYEMVQLKKPKETAIPKDEHMVEYSELDHLKMATMKPNVPSPKEQFTQSQEARRLDEHDWYSLLVPMADRWKELGGKVGISEDHLDEVYTNNPDNIQCLHNVVDIFYKMKKQTEIVQILRELGEHEIADKCDSPQENGCPLPGQTTGSTV